MTNQKQMMEKISVLDSKLETLHTDDVSSHSTLMELLTKISERLDQLGNNSSQSCCGGPVIIQTTPHANVVHQPILDSCRSCRDSKKEKRHECLASFPSENNIGVTSREGRDEVSANSSNVTSMRTLTDMENASDKIISRSQASVVLVSDTQNESSPKPGVASSLLSSAVELPVVNNKQDSSVMKVSYETDSIASGALPAVREHSPKGDGCSVVVREANSSPNGISSEASIVIDQPPVSTTASTASLLREVTTVLSQLREASLQAEYSKTSNLPPQKLTQSCAQSGSSHPALIQLTCTPVPPQHSPYIDHQKGSISNLADKNEAVHKTGRKEVAEIEPRLQRLPTVFPVSLGTVSGGAGRQCFPIGTLSGPSHYLPKPAILVANNSGAQSTNHQHSPSTPAVSRHSLSQGYVTLVTPSPSGVTSLTPSTSKARVTPTWQPQTVMTPAASHSTQQGANLHVSPAANAAMQRTGNDNDNDNNCIYYKILDCNWFSAHLFVT